MATLAMSRETVSNNIVTLERLGVGSTTIMNGFTIPAPERVDLVSAQSPQGIHRSKTRYKLTPAVPLLPPATLVGQENVMPEGLPGPEWL
jgi:hypothetical protein